MNDDDVTYLEGPVERLEGKLVLMIPLDAGGDQFIECARDISKVDGEFLKIVIEDWVADRLRIGEGSIVSIDNSKGRFNIHPLNPMTIQ